MSTFIQSERPDSEDALLLIQELEAVLAPQYPVESRHGYSVGKLIDQKVEFFVLRHNGERAGCAGVQFYDGGDKLRYGEVKRMYVRTGFRGLGFARLLLKHLEETAAARAVQILRLETGIYQLEAIRLYDLIFAQRERDSIRSCN
ncbi:GNAT family N-acetyltransferase [Chloroflexi bacterium TSY]|nr:GNAT family N-acetyltransferase [Chloroflexi bacterium TSY]